MSKRKEIIALVDADFIEYAAGFAGQHTYHLTTIGDDAILGVFDSAEDRNAAEQSWIEKGGDPEQLRRWERIEVEPVENVLHSVKRMLQTIEKAVAEKFKADVDMRVFLTGSGNFRERIATIKPYKGNRAPWHKPRLQREIREYLKDVWRAEVVYGQEADDEVCILQTELNAAGKNSIICGIDKDLLQCPGWHYDAGNDRFAKITPAQGAVQFYKQLLTGDPTDNVPGCYRMGAKAAKDMIHRAKQAYEKRQAGAAHTDLEAFLYSEVLQAYKQSIQRYGEKTGYAHMEPEDVVLEMGRLLWLRRERDQLWVPPSVGS